MDEHGHTAPRPMDPVDLRDALARWAGGELGAVATPDEVAAVRDQLEAAARHAVDLAAAGGADLAANPIRLSKGRITAVLGCERHLVETDGDGGPSKVGPGAEDLHLGVLVDALAEHHVVLGDRAGSTPTPGGLDGLAHAVDLVRAAGPDKAATVAWVDELGPDARRTVSERLAEKRAALLDRWPPFPGRWWPRTQEAVAVALADGDVVLSGRADVTVGGRPTRWPAVVVEVKSGHFGIEQRDDGLVYALLLALRDGEAPAAAITVTASGQTHLERATAERLGTAATRVAAAIVAAGELAGGRPPRERPGPRCDRCPVRASCAAAMARASDGSDA